MSRFNRVILTLAIPLALALAWAGGQSRSTEATIRHLHNISSDMDGLVRIGPNLYKGHRRGNPQDILYIAHVAEPGYGGPLETAAVVGGRKNIQYVAVLSSSDTRSYLEKVAGMGILDAFAGQAMEKMPEVDAVSGATISSTAIIRGIEKAVEQIGEAEFNIPAQERNDAPATPETTKLIMICLFFAAAFLISSKRFKSKRKAGTILLTLSVAVLGFWLGAQFSLSTVVSLLSGSWLKGMSTYAALLCLVLAVGSFLLTRKNLFCTYICPFGAIQEGLGRITGCSKPVQAGWMVWISRSWVLLVLLAALYYRIPSAAMYEPFGKAFNFIGSGIIYCLTILVILSSLVFKRPWCSLFCPTTSIFAYFRFARRSLRPHPGPGKLQPLEDVKK